jgi:hypothetical protein
VVRRLAYRTSLLITLGWVFALLPSPTDAVPMRLKNGLVGIGVVLGFGKLLYDTLFFERYQP